MNVLLDQGLRTEYEMLSRHDPECFGSYRACISCGCDRRGDYGEPKPCVSHVGSPRHLAYLLERIAKAAER